MHFFQLAQDDQDLVLFLDVVPAFTLIPEIRQVNYNACNKVQIHILVSRSNVTCLMRTKIGTVKQLDPGNKPLAAFLQNLQI